MTEPKRTSTSKRTSKRTSTSTGTAAPTGRLGQRRARAYRNPLPPDSPLYMAVEQGFALARVLDNTGVPWRSVTLADAKELVDDPADMFGRRPLGAHPLGLVGICCQYHRGPGSTRLEMLLDEQYAEEIAALPFVQFKEMPASKWVGRSTHYLWDADAQAHQDAAYSIYTSSPNGSGLVLRGSSHHKDRPLGPQPADVSGDGHAAKGDL